MTLINVKTKQDLIKLKKNLIKRAEEEKQLKDFNHDANLEKIYKPIVERLKQIVSETRGAIKSIDTFNSIPTILEEKTTNPCYQRCSNFLT